MPWVALPFGDTRCNRTAFGFLVDHEWVPLHDPASAVDLKTRDRFFAHVGEVSFGGSAAHLLAAKLVPVAIAHPPDLVVALSWARSALQRAGGLRRLLIAASQRRVRLLSFVVHQFMDAADVAPAWARMTSRTVADDAGLRAMQERLAACTYHAGPSRDRRAYPGLRAALGAGPR